ncbi:GLPGLI family protein [Hyunsoonleella sp. SJ7]|uniref:GLPGLI family protein n=1 Tax=Hyunsoonleella aquatilis TaxID=2762758 RepID=A0A923H8E1_9FLAO|nr:GLPGLI family protein [Hyunsoonleella aquatilis]MBC3758058.1 GLPGLI family protein [Hyunsoonleella aquatilis]
MTFISLKHIPILLFLFVSVFINAQDFQGKAIYMSKTSVDMSTFGRPEMSEEQRKRMEERLKTMFEKTFVLTFNRTESIYKEEEKLEAPNQGGFRFGAMMSGALEGIQYKNIQKKASLTEMELFGKLFLVKEELPQLNWKITGETKKIGNYMCFKATAIKTWEDFDFSSIRRPPRNEDEAESEEPETEEAPKETEITAWYTMQIPVNQGPGNYWGLPGLILEVSSDKTTILCSKIVLNPEDKANIKEPTKGKEVTKEEYIELATQKFQEMRENFRRGGGRRGGQRG